MLKLFAASQSHYIAAICAAPLAIKSAGLFKNSKITCYPGVHENLSPDYQYCSEEKVVVDSRLITSQGPGTAIEFALKIVEILQGSEVELKVAKDILHK